MRILVVDDESTVVSELVEWLISRGHEAIGITGNLGLPGWVVKQKCDVVLLDVHLQEANGLWLISQVHSAAPTTAIVVITGDLDPALETIALQEGARYYFTKPLDPTILGRALDKIMDENHHAA